MPTFSPSLITVRPIVSEIQAVKAGQTDIETYTQTRSLSLVSQSDAAYLGSHLARARARFELRAHKNFRKKSVSQSIQNALKRKARAVLRNEILIESIGSKIQHFHQV